MNGKESFLAKLLTKKAAVEKSQAESGANMKAALGEVDRQIKEALTGGDPNKGEGVTKSGGDD